MITLLSDSSTEVVKAVGTFLVRARQKRRALKARFERYHDKIAAKNFAAKKAAWRLRGKYSCRHGVLFATAPPEGCKCMADSTIEADWEAARYMPALCHELRVIIAVPFNFQTRQRLGMLQAQERHLGW